MDTSKTFKRKSPHGEPLRFLLDAFHRPTSAECIVWPYNTMGRGYGKLRFNGCVMGAHRAICLLAYGPPPQPTDGSRRVEAAHSCGNKACINPTHLRWASGKENSADNVAAGTSNRGENQGVAKLTEAAVHDIRARMHNTSQSELARCYGVSQTTVRRVITGETWGWLTSRT